MLDLVSGKKLDLLYISNEVDYDIYVNNNLLTDLYPFIDGDDEISRETFSEGILNALSDNGSLYEIPNAFTLKLL